MTDTSIRTIFLLLSLTLAVLVLLSFDYEFTKFGNILFRFVAISILVMVILFIDRLVGYDEG